MDELTARSTASSPAAAGNLADRMRHHVVIRNGPAKDEYGDPVVPNGAWKMMLDAADLIDNLTHKHLDGVPVLPVEDVARIFMQREMEAPFGAIKRGAFADFEYEQTMTRLTELLRRARADGDRSGRASAAEGAHADASKP